MQLKVNCSDNPVSVLLSFTTVVGGRMCLLNPLWRTIMFSINCQWKYEPSGIWMNSVLISNPHLAAVILITTTTLPAADKSSETEQIKFSGQLGISDGEESYLKEWVCVVKSPKWAGTRSPRSGVKFGLTWTINYFSELTDPGYRMSIRL